MSGIEFRDDVLVVDREPSDLDELALEFSEILRELGIEHVFVAGYVAILAGRARATQDIDVIVEPTDERTVQQMVSRLEDSGFWGPAMPLSEAHQMLSGGDRLWVARQDEMVPHLDVTYPNDEFDETSLRESIAGEIGGRRFPIGPLELQIAYKLYLDTEKDFEDAVHLYTTFEESLSSTELEHWVGKLDVIEAYERLQRA